MLSYDTGVILNLNKCECFTNRINYLRHLARPGYLKVWTRTIDSTRRLDNPTSVKELRTFLGQCNVFRRFVLSFAALPPR